MMTEFHHRGLIFLIRKKSGIGSEPSMRTSRRVSISFLKMLFGSFGARSEVSVATVF